MSAITIRNIPEDVHAGLRRVAKDRGQSVESLAREALIAMVKPKRGGVDFARLGAARAALGLVEDLGPWPEEFDDPAFSRAVLGLDP